MSNASTIRRQVSGTIQLTTAPLSGTTITTTETPFSLNNNALTGSGGGVIPLSAGVTGLYAGTGQVINIHIAGSATGLTSGSTTLILTVYVVPAAILPLTAAQSVSASTLVTAGATLIFTSTTGAAFVGTAGSFTLDINVQLDSQGNLLGDGSGNVFNTATTPKVTTLVLLTGEADLNFVVAATLGGTEAGVILTLNEFALNLI